MSKMLMYCTRLCPYFRRVERLLDQKGTQTERVMLDENTERRDEMVQLTGRLGVPPFFIRDIHIGGFAELARLECAGQLDSLLSP